jgi:hypothetical protein
MDKLQLLTPRMTVPGPKTGFDECFVQLIPSGEVAYPILSKTEDVAHPVYHILYCPFSLKTYGAKTI